jgi:hypothetical protein
VITGGGSVYNVAIGGMVGPGTVVATVNANAATGNISGLSNLASSSSDNVVTFSGAVKKESKSDY